MSVRLAFDNKTLKKSDNVALGQLQTATALTFKPYEMVGGEVARGQLFKAVLYVDSNGSITGTVDFGYKPTGILQLQTPAGNQMTVENNQPLSLNIPVSLDEITLTPSLSAAAGWRLELFTE